MKIIFFLLLIAFASCQSVVMMIPLEAGNSTNVKEIPIMDNGTLYSQFDHR